MNTLARGRVPGKRPRDTQRSKVYEAARSLDRFGRLETDREIDRFIDRLWRMKRVRQAFAEAWRRGAPDIDVPGWARTKGLVLAATTHAIISRTSWSMPVAWHGREFCEAYLRLTLYALGREAHDVLKAAFKANRVRFRPKRELSPERRAALADQLAARRPVRGPRLDLREGSVEAPAVPGRVLKL